MCEEEPLLSRETRDHFEAEKDEDPLPLNYAGPGMSRRETEPAMYGIVAGFISCAAMAVQIPWAFYVFMYLWGDAKPGLQGVPTISDEVAWSIALLLPTIFALVLGAVSMVGAGLSSRNTAGLTGCVLAVVAMLGFVAWRCCG